MTATLRISVGSKVLLVRRRNDITSNAVNFKPKSPSQRPLCTEGIDGDVPSRAAHHVSKNEDRASSLHRRTIQPRFLQQSACHMLSSNATKQSATDARATRHFFA
jgi:hypothetical protein